MNFARKSSRLTCRMTSGRRYFFSASHVVVWSVVSNQ